MTVVEQTKEVGIYCTKEEEENHINTDYIELLLEN